MKTMMKFVKLAAVAVLTFTSCNQDEAPNLRSEAPGNSFRVNLTDSPANYGRVDISMAEIAVYHDVAGWVPLYSTVRTLNVLTLANGATRPIASSLYVPLGHYSRVRILFADRNTVTLNGPMVIGEVDYDAGATLPLKWSHHSFYVEVPIDKRVTPEQGANLLLDFNVETSISEGASELLIDPAISVMEFRSTGIKGKIAGGNSPAFIEIDNGRHVYSGYADHTGSFLVRGVEEGEYHLIIRVMTRHPITGAMEEKKYERDDMKITALKVLDIGTIRF